MAKRTRKEIQEFLDKQNKDVPSLTDQELQDRIAAYEELGHVPTDTLDKTQQLYSEINAQARNLMERMGYGGEMSKSLVGHAGSWLGEKLLFSNMGEDEFKQNFSEFVRQNSIGWGRKDSRQHDDDGMRAMQEIGKGLYRDFKPRINEYYNPGGQITDTSADIKPLREIMDQRNFTKEQQAALDDFYKNTPEALEAERNRFTERQQSRAKDYVLGDFAPRAIEGLGARGLEDSGQVGDTIGRKFGEIQSTIESEAAAQEASDLQFFSDMAFKSTFQNLIAQRTDIRGQLDYEFTSRRQKQQQDFTAGENEIDRKFNLDLFKQEQERALRNYDKQVSAKKQSDQDQLVSGLIQTGVQTGANVGLIKALG